MDKLMNIDEGHDLLRKLKQDVIKQKIFKSKIEQGLNYIDDQKKERMADLQLVSFSQGNPPEQSTNEKSEGQEVRYFHQLDGPSNWIWKTLVSKNGSKIFSCGSDRMVYQWKLTSHNYHIQNFAVHDGIIYDIISNKHETIIISASKDKTVKLWSISDGVLLKVFNFEFEILRILLTKDESGLIVGGITGEIHIVNIISNSKTIFQGHAQVIRDLLLLNEGRSLLSCGQDGLIKLWNLENLECIQSASGHEKEVFSLALSCDEQKLYSCGNEEKVVVWELPALKQIDQFQAKEKTSFLKLSPSNQDLYVGLQSGEIHIYSTNQIQFKRRLTGHTDRITSIHVNEEETMVIASSRDKTIKFWRNDTIRNGIRNFNFNTKRGNLFSVDLSDEAEVLGSTYYKPATERPEYYHMTLSDNMGNKIWKIKLKPISYKQKENTEPEPKSIKVRIENITEFNTPIASIIKNPKLYQGFKYSSRFDNHEIDEALTIQHVIKKQELQAKHINKFLHQKQDGHKNKIKLIKEFDMEGDFVAQMRTILNSYNENELDHDAEYHAKLEAIGDRIHELFKYEFAVKKLNEDLKPFFDNNNSTLESLGETLGSVIEKEEFKDKLSAFFDKLKAKNPFIDSFFINGSLVNGILTGNATRIDTKNLLLKGFFQDGCLNGFGIRATNESILFGSFKNGVLEKKAFYIIEKNGIVRIADDLGEINKLCYRGVSYQANGISETYEGPAFISFKDGTCFTSIISCLRLVNDIINKHIVFYYGIEKKSHLLVYDHKTRMLKEGTRNIFQINWDNGQIIKL